jgi:hypothetical protein
MKTRAVAGLLVVLVIAGGLGAVLFTRGDEAPPKPATVPQQAPQHPAGRRLEAEPRTLDRVFASARGGDTIVLAAGRYGTFDGGMKDGTVTLKAAPDARVRMAVNFNPARNLVLDGLQITNLLIADARSGHLTVRNSRFDGAQAVIRTADLSNAAILFEHNTHAGFDKCGSCYEGRLQLVGRTAQPSGVTIRESVFGPGGNSDGIQNGGNGVRIIDNRFVDMHQSDGADGVHTDAIQLYGSKRTVISGNRMEDVATGIMAPDGADHEVIEHNRITTDGYPYAITIGQDDGSVIRDNALPGGGTCSYGNPCGTLRIFEGNSGAGGRGTVVENNVLGSLSIDAGSKLAVNRGNDVAIAN